MADTNRSTSRRTFLRRALALGGMMAAVFGASGAGRAAGPDGAEGSRPQNRGGAGYRLTPHIRRYYETAAR